MKKVLLSTSAIALAGAFATQASAAEWDVQVGGFFEGYAAFASSDTDDDEEFDGVDAKQDVEIIFKPSITLDNGLQFGADIQLEGNTGGDQIDESFLFIDGSFGEFLLGSENSAGYKMFFAAPDVSFVNVNSGSLTAFIPFSGGGRGDDVFRGTLGTTFLENDRNNDAQRFTYFTPRFAGFQLGLSYARDGLQDNNSQIDIDEDGVLNNIFDVGVNYVNSFGAIDVAVAGRWGIADFGDDDDDFGDFDDLDDNPQVYGIGANIGFAGFTIGGSFAEQNNAGTDDGRAFDAGVSYETGPWGVSFTYFNGENVADEGAADLDGDVADESLEQFLLAGTYDIGRGVQGMLFGAYVDFDEDEAAGDDDIDGFVVGTGIKLSF